MSQQQQFFIPGRLPDFNSMISAAKCRRGAWNGYALMKEEIETIIRYEIKRAKIKPMKQAAIQFVWREPNKRRNPDNVASAKKFILDSLVQARILANDGWSEIVSLTDVFEVIHDNQPGVKVTLR